MVHWWVWPCAAESAVWSQHIEHLVVKTKTVSKTGRCIIRIESQGATQWTESCLSDLTILAGTSLSSSYSRGVHAKGVKMDPSASSTWHLHGIMSSGAHPANPTNKSCHMGMTASCTPNKEFTWTFQLGIRLSAATMTYDTAA